MKKLYLSLIFIMSIIACQENIVPQQGEIIEVGFDCFAPSVTFDEIPLVETKSYSDEPRYIVQVKYDGSPYAYGVFNDITEQSIRMEEGKTYSITMSYFPNGHCLPFFDDSINCLTDGFVYSIDTEIYPDGTFRGGTGFINFIPSVKYYAENIEYTASFDNPNIDINLQAWVFGLQFKINNLTEGVVRVTCPGSNRFPELSFTSDNAEYEAIYSMYDHDGFEYTPDIQIIYADDSGIETSIYKGSIPTERLKKTLVTINLKDNSNMSKSSFDITLEEYAITDGESVEINQK